MTKVITPHHLKWMFVYIGSMRFIIHLLFYLKNKKMIDYDIARCNKGEQHILWQLTFHKDFRNLFYKRIGWVGYILNIWAPKQKDLYINANMPLGKACKFEHVHTTHLNAKSIGDNFMCFHLVTIGDSIYPHGTPTIGNNVTVFCNATILGKVNIGNNVIVAAGAVVVDSVPNNCVVAGVPAKIVKRLS